MGMRTAVALMLACTVLGADASPRREREIVVTLEKTNAEILMRDYRTVFAKHGVRLSAHAEAHKIRIGGRHTEDAEEIILMLDRNAPALNQLRASLADFRKCDSIEALMRLMRLRLFAIDKGLAAPVVEPAIFFPEAREEDVNESEDD
jgi:hypothetical protein